MSRNGAFRALVVEHERATPGGLVYDWLDDYNAEVEDLRIDVEETEVDPAEYDLLVPLGSEFAAYDDTVPWIEREKLAFPLIQLPMQMTEQGGSGGMWRSKAMWMAFGIMFAIDILNDERYTEHGT